MDSFLVGQYTFHQRRQSVLSHTTRQEHVSITIDLHPPLLLVTLEDGFAEDDFFVAVGEGGEGLGGVEVAGGDVVVEGLEGVLEGVVVAFVVATGITDVGEGGFGDEAGVAEQELVGLVAVADPELVGLFAVPGD